MKPGIYDISNEQYHSGEGISRSGVTLFKRSPYHFWNNYLNPDRKKKKQTEALLLGNAVHTLILEKEKFNDRYFVLEPINKATKSGKQYWKEVQQDIGNKDILSKKIYEQVLGIVDSLERSDIAKQLILDAQYERSIYWKDPESNVLCKCRPDIWHAKRICDLKTTLDASELAFKRDTLNNGYHIQAAMIQDGIQVATGKLISDFIFIAIEKDEPYAVAVYILSQDAIQKGRDVYKEVLHKYKKCLEENVWPGYDIQEISLPAWAA